MKQNADSMMKVRRQLFVFGIILVALLLPTHPDNDWLEFGVELGVTALLLLAMILLLMRIGWRNADARSAKTSGSIARASYLILFE